MLGSVIKSNCVAQVIFWIQFNHVLQVWSGPITQSLPWPTGCRFHSLTPLFDPESMTAVPVASQWMVLLWGKVSMSTISQDAWLLNVGTWTWKKLQVSGHFDRIHCGAL